MGRVVVLAARAPKLDGWGSASSLSCSSRQRYQCVFARDLLDLLKDQAHLIAKAVAGCQALSSLYRRLKKSPVPVLKGQKRSQNLAPVLVILYAGILWHFLGKLLPVLVFTGAAPPARRHQ